MYSAQRVEKNFPTAIEVKTSSAGQRLDQHLASQLNVSRARVQELIESGKILLNDALAKASFKLRGGENIKVLSPAERPPLRAVAEDIPIEIIYEDNDLAVINKPAGMMVHAGAGASEDARNRGTLVNALLHHFESLSGVGGEIRPGIVHRLDKETSGLIIVAKNDDAHRQLAAQFAGREVKKTYLALLHGWLKKDRGTIAAAISRDRVRRTRMTAGNAAGREAISHYQAIRRLDTAYGKFSLAQITIDTGRTHQIRVHMASIGHPVVGDRLYGAPAELRWTRKTRSVSSQNLCLDRNFLHAAHLEFRHPRTGRKISLESALPSKLQSFLNLLAAAS